MGGESQDQEYLEFSLPGSLWLSPHEKLRHLSSLHTLIQSPYCSPITLVGGRGVGREEGSRLVSLTSEMKAWTGMVKKKSSQGLSGPKVIIGLEMEGAINFPY